MTILSLLKEARDALSKSGIETPGLEAEILLEKVLKKDKIFFYTHPETEVSEEDILAYFYCVGLRLLRMPSAYILGKKEFMGLDFFTPPGVLIPRADSECLVETACELVEKNSASKVLDLCCGTGCLGLSLKAFKPSIELTLSDISETCIKVSRANSEALNIPVDIVQSDLFEQIPDRYDLIISNPPYISETEYKTLSPEIRGFEPKLALTAFKNGYDFYYRIIKEAQVHLSDHGYLLVEVGDTQAESVLELFKEFGYTDTGLRKDLSGFKRAVFGRYP